MHYVICTGLPDYRAPFGSTSPDTIKPIWPNDFLIYIAM